MRSKKLTTKALAALAVLAPAGAAHAATLDCTPQNEVAIRAQIARQVSQLKVASYRADASLMESASRDVESLLGEGGSCADAMKTRLCDSECFVQRASVSLFRATGLPLLSSKGPTPGDGTVTDPAKLLEQATKGIALTDEALNRLPRQQSLTQSGDGQKAIAFNAYVKSLARLSALKAKLLIAAGDIWYRQASVAHVESLGYLVAGALGDGQGPNGQKGSEYYNATTYYDEAFWLIMEARGTVPELDLFSAELASLAALDTDVSLRLDSVRKGFLFINVDPDDFTLLSVEDLGRRLYEQKNEIEQEEQKMQTLLETWTRKWGDLQNQRYDAENTANMRAMDLEAQKIAQIQDMAEQVKNGVQRKLNELNANISKFELQQRIRGIQTELDRETKDVRNQIAQVKGQTEQDLLALRKDSTRDDMGAIQFNIDMTMAAFNFDMQIDGLVVQIQELQNRLVADDTQANVLGNRKEQLQKSIEIEQRRMEAAGLLADRFRQSQQTVFRSSRVPIVHEICAVDAELAFYKGGAGGYTDAISGASCTVPPNTVPSNLTLTDEICQARSAMLNKSMEDIRSIKKCIDGTSAGTCTTEGVSLKNTVEQIYLQNKAIFDNRKATIQSQLADLKTRTNDLFRLVMEKDSLKKLQGLALAAQAAAGVAASFPDDETGVIGIFPVKTFRFSQAVAKALEIAADTAGKMVQWKYDDLQFENAISQELAQARQTVIELNGEVQALTAQDLLEQWQKKRALAEISVQLAGLDREHNQAQLENALNTVQCVHDKADIESTIARLQAQRAQFIAELQTKSDEAALTTYDIQEQESIRAQADIEIQRLNLESRQLDIELAGVNRDKANLVGMQSTLTGQMGKVKGYKGKVDALEKSYDVKRAVLNDINAKIENKTLDMSAKQQAYLLGVIDDSTKVAFSQIGDLSRQIAMIDEANGLDKQLLAIDADMRGAVLSSRERIMQLAAAAPKSNAEAIFWDFENLGAELTRGAPEFIDHKRRLLEDVNFTYNLYRNRYNMISGFASDVRSIALDKTFVKNSGDVETLLADCATVSTNHICHPSSLAWSKDTMTGSVSEFTIEKTSGLVAQLVDQGWARFEISPFAGSQAESRNLGSFVLWDERTMDENQSMTLVQAVASVQGPACSSQQVRIRHLGAGAVFAKLSKDSREIVRTLVVKRPTEALLPVYGDAETSLLNQEYLKFREGSYTADGLERKLHEGSATYPFVGYPLVATYELVADDKLVKCLRESAPSMKLGFIFVRK
jgi:hypothetical protein